MIKKCLRLTGKDINHLVKKRQYFSYDIFGIYYIQQYPHRPYNQLSMHVGLGVSKKSVIRHFVKRVVMRYISEHLLATKKFNDGYYKIFISIHKPQVPVVQKVVETQSLKAIQDMIYHKADLFFTRLYTVLGTSSKK